MNAKSLKRREGNELNAKTLNGRKRVERENLLSTRINTFLNRRFNRLFKAFNIRYLKARRKPVESFKSSAPATVIAGDINLFIATL